MLILQRLYEALHCYNVRIYALCAQGVILLISAVFIVCHYTFINIIVEIL